MFYGLYIQSEIFDALCLTVSDPQRKGKEAYFANVGVKDPSLHCKNLSSKRTLLTTTVSTYQDIFRGEGRFLCISSLAMCCDSLSLHILYLRSFTGG